MVVVLYKILYKAAVNKFKPVVFHGSSVEDLRAFPISARREAGYQLDRVQKGFQPDDWKPMARIGKGVQEIRIRDETGAFRVIYVAKLAHSIHVLHCFHKKTEKTNRHDIDLATTRYGELVREIKSSE